MVEPDLYTISLSDPVAEALEHRWKELEQRAEPNFFLSWCWVSVWLEVFRPNCQLVQVHSNGKLVGLGLLTINREQRHGFLNSRVLRLGQTGDADQDQIWIEYNDLLLDAEHCQQAPRAFLSFMLKQSNWDEFQFGASTTKRLQFYQHNALARVITWSAPTYSVDLDALRKSEKAYLEVLSRNTRYQINRSERLYDGAGGLEFTVVKDVDAILGHWDRLARLHIERWGDEPGKSGFTNDQFVAFHKALIQRGCSENQIELCTLSHQGNVIGLLYNFVFRGCVYFYLSGLEYAEDSRLKPGLVIHARAIQHYLDRGYHSYDFMGGEARYKQSLGKPHAELQLVCLQRPRLKLKLEQLGRYLKHKL